MSEFSAAVSREEHAHAHAPVNAAEEEEHYKMDCDENYDEDERDHPSPLPLPSSPTIWSSRNVVLLKCLLSGVVLYAALLAYVDYQHQNNSSNNILLETETEPLDDTQQQQQQRRRLTAVMGEVIPSYMNELNEDLEERKKLFEDTPPEEVKYWFEYTGPLQVSKSSSNISNIRSSSSSISGI
jgi:hypothetical protein